MDPQFRTSEGRQDFRNRGRLKLIARLDTELNSGQLLGCAVVSRQMLNSDTRSYFSSHSAAFMLPV